MSKFAFLLALAALPALSQRVVLVSGNGQMARENFPAGKPMVIQAVNAAGIGIPNAAVTWKVTQGEGALSDIVTTTDASGFASAVFRGVFLSRQFVSHFDRQRVSGSGRVRDRQRGFCRHDVH